MTVLARPGPALLLLIAFAIHAPTAQAADGGARDGAVARQAMRQQPIDPPLIVAHRAGTADAPENTLPAIRLALRHGADAIWLSVQLSSDRVPVLYRPQELSALTNGRGSVAAWPRAKLQRLNAGWNFRDDAGGFPYRAHPVRIPTLVEALAAIPPELPVLLDLKAAPSAALVDAVAAVLARRKEWSRVLLYSTDAGFTPLWARYPQARQFESRDQTRGRLLGIALAQRCEAPPAAAGWAAFELRRDLQIVERFTLGEGRNDIAGAQLWSPAAIACFRSRVPDYGVLWIGVASQDDYRSAWRSAATAVMVDSPRQARQWRRDAHWLHPALPGDRGDTRRHDPPAPVTAPATR